MDSTHANNTNHESGEIRKASPGEEQAQIIESDPALEAVRPELRSPLIEQADRILNNATKDNNKNSNSKSPSLSKNLKSTIGTSMVSTSLIVAFSTFISFGNTGTPLISAQPAMANTTAFKASSHRMEPTAALNTVPAVKSAPVYQESNPPVLQGATNGTLGPQGESVSFGYAETCGTVRVNNLANLEALLHLMSNGIEIFCIAWGGATLILGLRDMSSNEESGMPRACLGTLVVLCGLAAPGAIDWIFSVCRDLCLFN